jgi:hypothetical protein
LKKKTLRFGQGWEWKALVNLKEMTASIWFIKCRLGVLHTGFPEESAMQSTLPAYNAYGSPKISKSNIEINPNLFPHMTFLFKDILLALPCGVMYRNFHRSSCSWRPATMRPRQKQRTVSFSKVLEMFGDCYDAVTALPEPKKDPAVIMTHFAIDCMGLGMDGWSGSKVWNNVEFFLVVAFDSQTKH